MVGAVVVIIAEAAVAIFSGAAVAFFASGIVVETIGGISALTGNSSAIKVIPFATVSGDIRKSPAVPGSCVMNGSVTGVTSTETTGVMGFMLAKKSFPSGLSKYLGAVLTTILIFRCISSRLCSLRDIKLVFKAFLGLPHDC